MVILVVTSMFSNSVEFDIHYGSEKSILSSLHLTPGPELPFHTSLLYNILTLSLGVDHFLSLHYPMGLIITTG